MIYFDNAASWPILPSVMEVLGQSLQNDYANLSAAHSMGKDLFERAESMRQDFLKMVAAPEGYQFYFTGSATESNNWAIWQLNLKSGDKVFYSRADHPSLTVPLETSAAQLNLIPRRSDGRIDLPAWLEKLAPDTRAIFFTWVNGQSGHLEDIAEMASELKKRCPHLYIHIDGVQGFGKHLVSLHNGCIDSFSLSSHKIGGPKGIAGIYFRKAPSRALLCGGGQEAGMRAGTPAFPLIVGMHAAAQRMHANREEFLLKIKQLNHEARSRLSSHREISFPFAEEYCSPYIATLTVAGIPSDVILRHLEMEQVFCSSTAACSSKIKGINPVFSDLGIPHDLHKHVLRLSFGIQNTLEEVQVMSNLLGRVMHTISLLTQKR